MSEPCFYCEAGNVSNLKITSSNTGATLIFGSTAVLNINSTFSEIEIISTALPTSFPTNFGGKFQNCTIENITMTSNAKVLFVTYLNLCTVNNLLISSYTSIEMGGFFFSQIQGDFINYL